MKSRCYFWAQRGVRPEADLRLSEARRTVRGRKAKTR
jgi:hypothetical protein